MRAWISFTVGDFAWYDPVLQTLAHSRLRCRGGSASIPDRLTLPQYFTSPARGNAASNPPWR